MKLIEEQREYLQKIMGKCIKDYLYDYRKLRDEGNGLYLAKIILSFKITEELGLSSKDQRQ